MKRETKKRLSARDLRELGADPDRVRRVIPPEPPRRRLERRRRRNAALWYEFHMRIADAHAAISREHEARALALLEGPGGRAAPGAGVRNVPTQKTRTSWALEGGGKRCPATT